MSNLADYTFLDAVYRRGGALLQVHGVNAAGKVVEPTPMCERAAVERAAAEPCCLLKALAATVNKEKREPART